MLDIIDLVTHRSRTYAFQQGRHTRSVAQASAMVYVIRAEPCTHQFLKEIRFFVTSFGGAKTRLWLESDVFLFPTYHAEGLPYAVLEAMAAGCVAVASPVAAIADVVENGVNGLFVASQDAVALASAVRSLNNDRQRLRQLGVAGRARITAHYTLPRLAGDIERIYRLI